MKELEEGKKLEGGKEKRPTAGERATRAGKWENKSKTEKPSRRKEGGVVRQRQNKKLLRGSCERETVCARER